MKRICTDKILEKNSCKSAAEFYVEIMNQKHVLSREKSCEVGLIYARRDFAKKLGQEPPLAAFWNSLAQKSGSF